MSDYIQIPPDSTGKKVLNVAHISGSDTIYAQVTHLADPTDSSKMQIVDKYGAASITFAEGAPTLTPFAKLRTGEEIILGGYEYSTGPQDSLFYQKTLNNGIVSHNSQSAMMLLQTDTTSGSYALHSTNRYHFYQPGNGISLLNSIILGDAGKPNNIRRWGLFDDNNGVFFELSGSSLYAVIRSDASGVVEERKISQSSWNIDPLDGTGPSKFILDITKVNLWGIDYAWLGVGQVRLGVVDERGHRLASHTFQNVGSLNLPWASRSSFPVRTENVNIGSTAGSSEIRQICSAVYSEARTDYVYWRYADLGVSRKPVTDDTPMLSVRSKQIYNGRTNRVNAYLEDITVYVETGPIKIEAVWSPVLSGSTWTVPSIGPLECDTSASSYIYGADGYVFRCWMLGPGTHQIDLSKYFETNDEGILLNGDGITQSAFSFTGTSLNMATPATASIVLNYKELS